MPKPTAPPLRALTVRQPWAAQIMTGEKSIEYRCWPTRWRGTLLVHAAAKRLSREDAAACPYPLVYGALLGAVELVDCVGAAGDWEWILESPRPFASPIPCSGQLSLWTPPPVVMQAVLSALS